jgi:hypothetical protein
VKVNAATKIDHVPEELGVNTELKRFGAPPTIALIAPRVPRFAVASPVAKLLVGSEAEETIVAVCVEFRVPVEVVEIETLGRT